MGDLQSQAGERRKLWAAERALARAGRARLRGIPVIFVMTDPHRTPEPWRLIARLPRSWGVVYRHYGRQDRLEVGLRIARECRKTRRVLLVSDDALLARRIGCAGLHIPEKRLRAVRRPLRRRGWLITASAHGWAGLRRAGMAGADLAFLSPAFPSRSPSAQRPLGLRRMRALSRLSGLPVYALGGISARTAGRLAPLGGSGLSGAALIGAAADLWGG